MVVFECELCSCYASAEDFQYIADIRDFTLTYSGHGSLILLSLQMEAQAQYKKDCVGSLLSLQEDTS